MFLGIAIPAVAEVNRASFLFLLIAAAWVFSRVVVLGVPAAWVYRLNYGLPMFGRYGGVPSSVLKAGIECAADFRVDLPDQDMKDLAAAAQANEDFVAAHTKNAYLRDHKERTGQLPTQEQWDNYWDKQTEHPIAGSSYRHALTEHPQVFALMSGWLFHTVLIVPLAVIGFAAVTLLSPFAAAAPSVVPVMLMISVFFALLATVVALWSSSIRRGETIPLDRPAEFGAQVDMLTYLSERERSDLKAQAAALAGRTARIIDVEMGVRCKGAVTRFLGRQLAVTLAILLIAAIAEIGICLLTAALFTEHFTPFTTRYGRQAELLAQSAVVALIAYYFWAFLLSRVGDIVGPAIGAAITAVIIPAGQYIVTGHLKLDAGTIIQTVTAAAAGAFGAKLAELAKRPGNAPPQRN